MKYGGIGTPLVVPDFRQAHRKSQRTLSGCNPFPAVLQSVGVARNDERRPTASTNSSTHTVGTRIQRHIVLRLFNTLGKKVEEVTTLEPGVVRMYTCGPTVYRYAHIGNLRSYLMADWIRRTLQQRGNQVVHVKNITDIGHMRQEALETGGDKIILAAIAEGKTPQEIAEFYTDSFLEDELRLNILPAHHFPRATDHISEMVEVIKRLFANGHAYASAGNVYFDVANFSDYGKLSGNPEQGLMEGVRSEVDPDKRDPRDFTLWKKAEEGRDMKWDSPWGEGFPGWHIECSAMSTKYMGEQLDIHTGGVDNIFPHHEDEIAQSEGAFGKPFVRCWVHGQHLLADGVKMAKSAGNEFILQDLVDRGFDPLAFRYLCATVRYRHRMNFTFTALKGAQRALTSLRDRVWELRCFTDGTSGSGDGRVQEWRAKFQDTVDQDLDIPGGLAVMWDLMRSELPPKDKLELALEYDRILGFGLEAVPGLYHTPDDVGASVSVRDALRKASNYPRADEIRDRINSAGYLVKDTRAGPMLRPLTEREKAVERWPAVSSSREVESLLDQPDAVAFSFVTLANEYVGDLKRCVDSVLKWTADESFEFIIVDNGATDGAGEWAEQLSRDDPRVRTIHCDHILGDAAAKNIGLKQSLGHIVIILDTSVEVLGNVTDTVRSLLEQPSVGMAGAWGVTSPDLRHFNEEGAVGEVDAMQGYCIAFKRENLNVAGLMRETFRFYRNLDLDFSFQFKDKGYKIVADDTLPLARHQHRQWEALGEAERDELSLQNFRRFLKRWGRRTDLLADADSDGHSHHHDHDH